MLAKYRTRLALWLLGGSKPQQVYVARLSPDVFAQLKQRVNGSCIVTTTTTDLQAGFQLGVNHAINVVAEGFTISHT